jgi:hypothetical protein
LGGIGPRSAHLLHDLGIDRTRILGKLVEELRQPIVLELLTQGMIHVARQASPTDSFASLTENLLVEGE